VHELGTRLQDILGDLRGRRPAGKASLSVTDRRGPFEGRV